MEGVSNLVENRFELGDDSVLVSSSNPTFKPNPEIACSYRSKSAKIYIFSRGAQKNLNQPGWSSRTICYGEDFFFKYSSIVNACGNGGKPLPCLQRRGSSLWTLSGRNHSTLRMHCVWIFIHFLDSTPFEYSCT